MISTTKRRVLIIVLAIFAMFMTFASGLTYAFANQNTVLEQINFTMINGAQIRLDGQKGMRFAAEISKSDYQKIENAYETLEYGVFIMPKYYVTNYGALNKENTIDGGKYVWSTDDKIYENPTVVEGGKTKYRIIHMESMADIDPQIDGYVVRGSVQNILDENMATDYTARAYIKATNAQGEVEYKFADEHKGARSFVEVAFRVLNKEIYNDENDPNREIRNELDSLVANFEDYYSNSTISYTVNYVDYNTSEIVGTKTETGVELNTPIVYDDVSVSCYRIDQTKLPDEADARVYAPNETLIVYVYGAENLDGDLYQGEVAYLEKTSTAQTQSFVLPKAVGSVNDFKINDQDLLEVSYNNATKEITINTSDIQSVASGVKTCTFEDANGKLYSVNLTIADYVINNDNQVNKLAYTDDDNYIVLATNVDASGIGGFYSETPNEVFTGTIDGKGNLISNLSISNTVGWWGLIGRTTPDAVTGASYSKVFAGTIKNIAFINVCNPGSRGLFAQVVDGGTIENVYIQGTSNREQLFATIDNGGVIVRDVILDFYDGYDAQYIGCICTFRTDNGDAASTGSINGTENVDYYNIYGNQSNWIQENFGLTFGDFAVTRDGLKFNGNLLIEEQIDNVEIEIINLNEENGLSIIGALAHDTQQTNQTIKLPRLPVTIDSISKLKIAGTSVPFTYNKYTKVLTVATSDVTALDASGHVDVVIETDFIKNYTGTIAIVSEGQILADVSDVNEKLSRARNNIDTRTLYLVADVDGAVIENLAPWVSTETNLYGLGHKLTNLTIKGEGLFGQYACGKLYDIAIEVKSFEPDWYGDRYTNSDVLGGDVSNFEANNVYIKLNNGYLKIPNLLNTAEYEQTIIDTCCGGIQFVNCIFDIGQIDIVRAHDWNNAHENDDYSSLLLMDENFFTTYANGLPESFANSAFEIFDGELYFNGKLVSETVTNQPEEPDEPDEPEQPEEVVAYTGATSTVAYGNTGANKGNINGLMVSLTDGDMFTYVEPIDFSTKTSSNNKIQLYVLPKTQGFADVKNFFVRFTDTLDPTNYFEIRLMANYDDPNEISGQALYTSVKASNQKDFVGKSSWSDTTYTEVMVVRPQGYASFMASLTAKNGYGGSQRFSDPFEYSFDYSSKQVYGYKYDTSSSSGTIIADLDSSSYYGSTTWSGFSSGGKAYVSVYSTDVVGESFDFVITNFFGENLTNVANSGIDGNTDDYRIVIPENADGNERTAAHELQKFVEEATSIRIPIIRDNANFNVTDGVKYFSVGNTSTTKFSARENIDLTNAKDNGYVIKTQGDVIYLLGKTTFGTSNAVYGYLNEAYGFEYYFTDTYDLTASNTVIFGNYNLTVNPDIDSLTGPNVGFVQQNSINRHRFGVNANEELFIPANGSTGVHNVDKIVTESDMAAHPDWVSTDGGTLCFSARSHGGTEYVAMQNHFLEVIKKGLAQSSANIFLIAQPDNQASCSCSACKGSSWYDKYNTSDVLLRFCNDLVDKVYDWFETTDGQVYSRDFKIYFLAYHTTQEPPKEITFNENVGVYVAFDGFYGSYSLTNTTNSSYVTKANSWKTKSNGNFGFWLYDLNADEYAYPYDTSVYRQAFYQQLEGAKFINEQGQFQHDKNAMTWGNYKNYISSKLRWDSYLDSATLTTLTENFFKACYKDAWDEMLGVYNAQLTYWTSLRNSYSNSYDLGNIFGKIDTSTYWNKTDVEAWYNGFKNAFTALEGQRASLDTVTYTRIHDMICAEIISPMTMLIELHGYKTNTTFVNEFKQYVTDSGIRFPWDGTGAGSSISYWYGTLEI
ncbi:MAG: DUF4838 domain-containing protein [Clostridia bacterium]|nr:DUF4838 domain-containing protein [Clostridia bacterium]